MNSKPMQVVELYAIARGPPDLSGTDKALIDIGLVGQSYPEGRQCKARYSNSPSPNCGIRARTFARSSATTGIDTARRVVKSPIQSRIIEN